MAAYNKKQLEEAWVRNGGPKASASLAAAIAFAESSGNRNPYGDKGLGGTGYTSFGPWQIHTPAHPQYSPERLVDNIDYSAKAAIAVSNGGTDFSPWTTYKTGAYKTYLGGATAGATTDTGLFFEINPLGIPSYVNPLKAPNPLGAGEALVEGVEGVGGIGGALSSATGALAGLSQFFTTAEEWLTDPLRIVKLVGGGIIAIMGLHSLTRGSVGGIVVQQTRAAPSKALSLAKRAAETGAEA